MATTKAATRAAPAQRANPFQTFIWEGTDKRGSKMKGESQSKSANMVRAELRKQGINPTTVKEKKKPLFGKAGKRITALDIAIFSRQIATMLQSGVPMVQSFEILATGQKNERMRVMLEDIRDSISGGSTLYESLGHHPVQFDELYSLTRRPAPSVKTTVMTARAVIETVRRRSTYSRPPSAWPAARVIWGTRTALITPPASRR